jgi:hypothetical protein
MDFSRALTYPFDDDEWLQKLGLATLIQFIPIVGPIVLLGWSLEISTRVKRQDPTPLPDWSEFGEYLRKGFLIFVAYLVYQLPTIIFMCVASFIWVLPTMGAGNEDAMAALGGAAVFVVICCACLVVLYALAAAVVLFGGYVRFINRPELGTFFEFGDNIAIVRENLGEFGMVLLYVILAGVIASVVSSITVGLGGLLSTPFLTYFTGYLLGDLARSVAPGEPAV